MTSPLVALAAAVLALGAQAGWWQRQVVAVTGRTGAGKSPLLRALAAGDYTPHRRAAARMTTLAPAH